MYQQVLKYSPETWDKQQTVTRREFKLSPYSEEYKQIAFEANAAMNKNYSGLEIYRVQNIHDLGQCLIKQQKMLVEFPEKTFYQGRRYIILPKQYLNDALEYNMDQRRVDRSQLVFKKNVNELHGNNILFSVQCILKTQNHDAIVPEYSDEYYIDYYIMKL